MIEPEDPAQQSSAEDLDEDRIGKDPVEEGVDPPDDWSEADRYGVTAREQAEDRPLSDRLAEETPDQQPDPDPEQSIGATPDDQLDQTIDEAPPMDDPEGGPPEEEGVNTL